MSPKRWGSWEAALLHFGYSEEEVARRLTSKNNIITRDWDPDALLPDGLPMASLSDDEPGGLPLTADAVGKLRTAYAELPRRSRYILTVRLGLATETRTLKRSAEPLALSLDRIRQLQVQAVEALVDAVSSERTADRGKLRDAVQATLTALATSGVT